MPENFMPSVLAHQPLPSRRHLQLLALLKSIGPQKTFSPLTDAKDDGRGAISTGSRAAGTTIARGDGSERDGNADGRLVACPDTAAPTRTCAG